MQLQVNGREYRLDVLPTSYLVDVLRDDIGLIGTREACDEGECGACTVILNGKAVDSCILLALQADGSAVETVEGLATAQGLHPLQSAFIEEGAVQCGYCTPGMLLSAKALLDETQTPDEQQIREALAGNICRCTGYGTIVDAVQRAAAAMRGDMAQ